MKKLFITPRYARYYLIFAALLILLPTLLTKLFPSHQGKFLVASGAMNDTNFNQTVLYMTYHDFFGAAGFVINQPLQGDVLTQAKERFPQMGKFHYGGPVLHPYKYYWLVPSANTQHGFEIISPEKLQEDAPDKYNAIIANDDIAKDVWVMQGYAGWASMQLNKEVLRYGSWDTIKYDRAFMFDLSHDKQWYSAVEKILDEKKVNIDAL